MAFDLEAVRAFLKVAEVASFTRAASHLGLSKSRVSLLVKGLEEALGAKLFQRSTRTVQLTADGEQFFARAERLVSDADELSSMFLQPSTLKGRLRIDLPVVIARERIIPRLAEFLAAHPKLDVQVSATDRRVDVIREGFDCVLRVGPLDDSALVAKKLGVMPMMNCASPGYLIKHGTPKMVDDLNEHFLVHYEGDFGADEPAFEYREAGRYQTWPMRAVVTVNNVDAYYAACKAGLGIVQVPRTAMAESIVAGDVVEVLHQWCAQPLPVSIVHGYSRAVPQRVRVFMGWLQKVLAPHVSS